MDLATQQLVQSYQRGDQASFAVLVQRYSDRLLHYFALQGLSPQLAEDCVQDTLTQAWKNRRKLREASAFPAWLFGIARYTCWSRVRRQQTRTHSSVHDVELPGSTKDSGEFAALQTEMQDQVQAALAKLPEKMRLVLQLRFLERCSCQEIGEILNLTPAAVSSLLYRAKERLRRECQALAN